MNLIEHIVFMDMIFLAVGRFSLEAKLVIERISKKGHLNQLSILSDDFLLLALGMDYALYVCGGIIQKFGECTIGMYFIASVRFTLITLSTSPFCVSPLIAVTQELT